VHELDFLKVVSDDTDVCSYLPQQIARMPLKVPTARLTPEQLDQMLAGGYRRSGWFFYKTQCPSCVACEPLRIEVEQFQPSRSQRRAQKRGDQLLQTRISHPTVDERRLELFNRHRMERQLSQGDGPVGMADYQSYLINSYTTVLELSLWLDERLIAVSITDVGLDSLSAVYCYFDPDHADLNPGTYAILQQVHLARTRGFRWLYLGLMVAANAHLKYKANFRPHQRLIGGQWQLFGERIGELPAD
jgi:arginyl-tRNA--protein-N-Asp/Glu arginylyltransferase